MSNTYTISVETRNSNNVSATFRNVPNYKVEPCVSVLETAFRDIEVVDEETGEVVYSKYVGGDWFEAEASVGEVIDEINDYLAEPETTMVPTWVGNILTTLQDMAQEIYTLEVD
jgi:hypothetical protein